MTTTLRDFYKDSIELRVLKHSMDNDQYRRKILLTLAGDRKVVEFGIVRLDLRLTSREVREQIEARDVPLGDILVTHQVLRRIDTRWLLRFGPGSPVLDHFGDPPPSEAFGRMATILLDGKPAVDLLEVVSGL